MKNCLFGTFKPTRNAIKIKFIYNGQKIVFDGADKWSFCNVFARNNVIFSVRNSLSFHTKSCKNNFLVLGERPKDDIFHSVGKVEKKNSVLNLP